MYRVLRVDLDLMPLSTEAPRCSEFAREIGLLPPGSGLFLERVILVTVPLPWPKPAMNHPMLVAANGFVNGATAQTRLFAAEPVAGELRVEVYERTGAGAVLHDWVLEAETAVDALVAAIVEAPVGELGDVRVEGASPGAVIVPAPTFLVCTQGSHDLCCGVDGVALADEIEAKRDYVVRRVSHTGGHRFAPTFLALPEGRMWAYADLALVDRIAAGTATADDHRTRARGWWGAPVGPAQAAECAVRAELADEPFSEPRIDAMTTGDGASPRSFGVRVGDRSWRIDVEVKRLVPSIACEAPGGLPSKPGREFSWTIKAG